MALLLGLLLVVGVVVGAAALVSLMVVIEARMEGTR